jgi:hypothetical protein
MIDEQHWSEWHEDCRKWRGCTLDPRHPSAHWCYDWDGLPLDHTCAEWPCNCAAMTEVSGDPVA